MEFDVTKDGGQAFQNGMSLRDWFAGIALQGAIDYARENTNWDAVAVQAFRAADAMLKEREK